MLFNEDRCIALVRNTGIKSARGRIVMTIDCDNRMTKGTISEIYRLMKGGRKYTVLKKNYLINSTRKYDDLGDWLYFRLIFENFGTLIKAAFGKNEDYDRMYYDYNK